MTKPTKAMTANTVYWTYNDPKLPAIVMIHGFRGTHHGLDLIAQELSAYHLIVPDLPGFGESPSLKKAHTLENYTEWLHGFMKDLKLKKPVLLGHSFGSIIAGSYAANYPKALSKLILINPIGAPALEGPKGLLTQLAIFYYFVGRKLPHTLALPWLKSKLVVMIMSRTMAKTTDKTLRQFIHDQHRTYFSRFNDAAALSQSFITSVSHNVRESAPDITTKTLLIAGDKDDITPLHKQRELVLLFPEAELVVLKDVGHLTHYETPQQAAKAIKKFLAD